MVIRIKSENFEAFKEEVVGICKKYQFELVAGGLWGISICTAEGNANAEEIQTAIYSIGPRGINAN